MGARKCFRCQGLGHIAFKCLNKRVVTLAECQLVWEKLKELEEDGGEELLLTKEIEEYEEGPDVERC